MTALLDTLAERGVVGVPPSRWQEVARECDRRARTSGDGRYPVLRSVLLKTASWWDEQGGVPKALAEKIDRIILAQLPPTLATDCPACGYARAVRIGEELAELLTGTNDWIEHGYVSQVH